MAAGSCSSPTPPSTSKQSADPRTVSGANVGDSGVGRSRVPRSTDRSGREAIISCGAALDHFRVAMAAGGWNTTVDQFLTARFRPGRQRPPALL